jgi:hypothetical protein
MSFASSESFYGSEYMKTGTVARPGFGGDCEALGEGPVVDSEEGLLLSSKASPATGGRRWKDGRALVASAMAAASSRVTGDSEVSAAILFNNNYYITTATASLRNFPSLRISGKASQPLIYIDNWGQSEI